MFPPVYQTLNVPGVDAIVHGRIAPHGEIGQGEARPYLTWFVVSAQPYDNLSSSPCGDFQTVQIDCWHPDAKGIVDLAAAVRAALDAASVCNRVRLNLREATGSRLYRVGMEADFITDR